MQVLSRFCRKQRIFDAILGFTLMRFGIILLS